MKILSNIIKGVLVSIWFVIAVFVTACLLSYNDYKVTVFGKNTLLIVDSEEMEPDYLEGDLLIIKKKSDNKINVGDEVFYYNTSKNTETNVFTSKVLEKDTQDKSETVYVLNDTKVSSSYIIGTKDSVTIYHKLGTILGVLTSKWGYMFLVIFPTLFATIYEIVMIVESAKQKEN